MNLSVILPIPFSCGVLRHALNIMKMLTLGAKARGDSLSLSFGYPKEMNLDKHFHNSLKDLNINLRPFSTQLIPSELLNNYYGSLIKVKPNTDVTEYGIFNDGISNFEEADFWLILSDHIYYALPQHKPYAIFVYDYVQKYCPEVLNEEQWVVFSRRAQVTRQAKFVMTSTKQTKRDVICYAGVDPHLVHKFYVNFNPPGIFNICNSDIVTTTRPYIFWSTSLSRHENHIPVLNELINFLNEYDAQVIVTGSELESIDPENPNPRIYSPYIEEVRQIIKKSRLLSEKLIIKGCLEEEKYVSLIQNASYVLHTSTGDNGAYLPIDAAWLRVHCVASCYPAMQEIAEQFNLPIIWFYPRKKDSLAQALAEAFNNASIYRERLPNQEHLSRFSCELMANEFWQNFRNHIL